MVTSMQHAFSRHYSSTTGGWPHCSWQHGTDCSADQAHRVAQPDLRRVSGSLHRHAVAHNPQRLCAKKQPSLHLISLGSGSLWRLVAHHSTELAGRCRRLSLESSLAAVSGSPPRH